MDEETKVSKDLMKTLSVDTRVDILKLLDARPMTASEIARSLNKHVTTVSDHLDILKNSKLVERVERPGHKWVYYKKTRDAETILHPKVYQRWVIVLSLSFLVITGSLVGFVNANPGEPLYPLKKFRETIQLGIARDENAKAQLHVKFAEERLKEAKVVAEKDDIQTVNDSIEEYRREIEHARKEVEMAKVRGKNVQLVLEEINESKAKHLMILANIEKRQPDLKDEIEILVNTTLESDS